MLIGVQDVTNWRLARIGLAAIVWVGAASVASAQDDRRSNGYNAIIDNLDLLVDNYSRFMAKKYNLNEEQHSFTQNLIRERARTFISGHEGELRDLFETMFQVRAGGEMSQEGLVGWAKRAAPIYEEAKKLLETSNAEWREILTDEQRAMHDEDLKIMHEGFEMTDTQLGRMLSGEMTVDEFRNPKTGTRAASRRPPRPAAVNEDGSPNNDHVKRPKVMPKGADGSDAPHSEPVVVAEQPMTPPDQGVVEKHPDPASAEASGQQVEQPTEPQPDAGHAEAKQPDPQPDPQPQPEPQPEVVHPPQPGATGGGATRQPTRNPAPGKPVAESEWEKYVREFCARYKLDEPQTQQANTILKQCQENAEKISASKKNELEEIDRKLNELKSSKDPAKTKESTELTKRRAALLEPINKIFEQQLKPKLERIPTRAQRRAAEEAAKKPAPKAETPAGKDKPAAPGKTGTPGKP